MFNNIVAMVPAFRVRTGGCPQKWSIGRARNSALNPASARIASVPPTL